MKLSNGIEKISELDENLTRTQERSCVTHCDARALAKQCILRSTVWDTGSRVSWVSRLSAIFLQIRDTILSPEASSPRQFPSFRATMRCLRARVAPILSACKRVTGILFPSEGKFSCQRRPLLLYVQVLYPRQRRPPHTSLTPGFSELQVPSLPRNASATSEVPSSYRRHQPLAGGRNPRQDPPPVVRFQLNDAVAGLHCVPTSEPLFQRRPWLRQVSPRHGRTVPVQCPVSMQKTTAGSASANRTATEREGDVLVERTC